jgi:hypothetical protein
MTQHNTQRIMYEWCCLEVRVGGLYGVDEFLGVEGLRGEGLRRI